MESDVLPLALSSKYLPSIKKDPSIMLVSYNIKWLSPKRWKVLSTLTINEIPIPNEYITSIFKFKCLIDVIPDFIIGYET